MINEKELLDTAHKYKMEEIKLEQGLIKDNTSLKHEFYMLEQNNARETEKLKHEWAKEINRIISAEKRKSIERRELREGQRQFAGSMEHPQGARPARPGRPPE